MKTPEEDAWKQLHELWDKFSTRVDVRNDLRVEALGPDRAVRVSIAYPQQKAHEIRRWHTSMPRNVGTMRELAQAIIDACDFVDAVNPKWASHHPAGPIVIPEAP